MIITGGLVYGGLVYELGLDALDADCAVYGAIDKWPRVWVSREDFDSQAGPRQVRVIIPDAAASPASGEPER
jgi:hypothetical protein